MSNNLPKRKKIRISNYDYSQSGMYFITICTQNKLKLFGEIVNDTDICLSNYGKIVEKYINKISEIYSKVNLENYVIMPNHIHMIILLKEKNKVTISKIVQQFKINVTKQSKNSFWQKSFYEHIIRNEREYLQINEYIENNIINWRYDKYLQ